MHLGAHPPALRFLPAPDRVPDKPGAMGWRYVAVGFGSLVAASAVYERALDWRDARVLEKSRPGRMVRVKGGVRVHCVVTEASAGANGRCKPYTAVLLGDAATSVFDWAKCWDGMARPPVAKVVTYDRPGMGLSDHASRDGNKGVLTQADELSSLLDNIGEVEDNLILVGHGQGAKLAIAFAAKNRPRVKGMVFLDPVCPGVREAHCKIHPDMRRAISGMKRDSDLMALLSHFGVARFLTSLPLTREHLRRKYLPEHVPLVSALSATRGHREAVRDEIIEVEKDEEVIEDILQNMWPKGDFPVVIVGHGLSMFHSLGRLHGGDESLALALERAWDGAQRALASSLSSQSVFVRAAGVGHDMPQIWPEVVLDSVDAVGRACDGDDKRAASALAGLRSKWHTLTLQNVEKVHEKQ